MSDPPKLESESDEAPKRTRGVKCKCTRGVRCLLLHVVATGGALLLLGCVCAAHALLTHPRRGAAAAPRAARRLHDGAGGDAPAAVGRASVRGRVLCGCVLVGARWSLAPAHCVSARAAPELARLLPHWRIRYGRTSHRESEIKRGVVHSFFNKDDFDNNIGLFQHFDRMTTPPLQFSNIVASDLLEESNQHLEVFGWSTADETYKSKARVLNSKKCSEFVEAIVARPRPAEACVQAAAGAEGGGGGVHGAVLLLESRAVALLAWGDRDARAPQVALLLAPYRAWILRTMELYD